MGYPPWLRTPPKKWYIYISILYIYIHIWDTPHDVMETSKILTIYRYRVGIIRSSSFASFICWCTKGYKKCKKTSMSSMKKTNITSIWDCVLTSSFLWSTAWARAAANTFSPNKRHGVTSRESGIANNRKICRDRNKTDQREWLHSLTSHQPALCCNRHEILRGWWFAATQGTPSSNGAGSRVPIFFHWKTLWKLGLLSMTISWTVPKISLTILIHHYG